MANDSMDSKTNRILEDREPGQFFPGSQNILQNRCDQNRITRTFGLQDGHTSVLPWKSIGSWPGPLENANVQTATADLSS